MTQATTSPLKKINTHSPQFIFPFCTLLKVEWTSVLLDCNVPSYAAGGDSSVTALSTPGAGGLGHFLVPPFVESFDVAVAPENAIAGLQFPQQQAEEVARQMAPPVVDLPHYNVSGP